MFKVGDVGASCILNCLTVSFYGSLISVEHCPSYFSLCQWVSILYGGGVDCVQFSFVNVRSSVRDLMTLSLEEEGAQEL